MACRAATVEPIAGGSDQHAGHPTAVIAAAPTSQDERVDRRPGSTSARLARPRGVNALRPTARSTDPTVPMTIAGAIASIPAMVCWPAVAPSAVVVVRSPVDPAACRAIAWATTIRPAKPGGDGEQPHRRDLDVDAVGDMLGRSPPSSKSTTYSASS